MDTATKQVCELSLNLTWLWGFGAMKATVDKKLPPGWFHWMLSRKRGLDLSLCVVHFTLVILVLRSVNPSSKHEVLGATLSALLWTALSSVHPIFLSYFLLFFFFSSCFFFSLRYEATLSASLICLVSLDVYQSMRHDTSFIACSVFLAYPVILSHVLSAPIIFLEHETFFLFSPNIFFVKPLIFWINTVWQAYSSNVSWASLESNGQKFLTLK